MSESKKKNTSEMEKCETQEFYMNPYVFSDYKKKVDKCKIVCNNTINYGDCYGETFCNSCNHPKYIYCSCGLKFCGHCWYQQHRFTICPYCDKKPNP